MRYALRTTFTLTEAQHPFADEFLRWLFETLPTAATMGCDVAQPQWIGNRFEEFGAEFEILTQYRNQFAATADRLRIAGFASSSPYFASSNPNRIGPPEFALLRVFSETDLGTSGEPTKKYTYPC